MASAMAWAAAVRDLAPLAQLALAPPVRGLTITPDRVAYYGAFGRPSPRCLGSWALYLSLDLPFTLHEADHEARSSHLALVPPWTPHRVLPGASELGVLLIEPDSVDGDALQARLMGNASMQRRTAISVAEGFGRPRAADADLDLQFFGAALPTRAIDDRIRRVIALIANPDSRTLSAEHCAGQVFLSPSRFMHLFSEQTDTTFRRFRAWKRARRMLSLLAGHPRLIEAALDAGYADSTHLSRAMRSCYGYTPSALSAFTRDLPVVARL